MGRSLAPEKIAVARARDRLAKERYFSTADAATESRNEIDGRTERGFGRRLRKWWS
jgi:hypothetical protein